MPMILVESSIAAGTSNPNIYTGSAFEFARQRGVLSIGICAAATGLFALLQAGGRIIAEEFALPILTRYPVIPDEFYFTDVVDPMDRIVAAVRSTAGGAVICRSVVQIS